jgi:hypothetical protein
VRISLSQLKAFSECPAFYHFLLKSIPVSPSIYQKVVEDVIKKSLIIATETSFRVEWRRIVGWVDTEVFRDVDMINKDSFAAARSVSEAILQSVRKWYDGYYLKENKVTFIDLPIEEEFGDHIVYGTIPIVQISDVPTVSVFSQIGLQKHQVANDYEFRVLAMMVAGQLDNEDVNVRVYGIGNKGGLEVSEIGCGKKEHKATRKYVLQLVRAMGNGVDYPSRTQQCNSCSFLRRCNT